MIKVLIGGSPCTHWSIAQKNNRETKAEGIGWELFKNYLIAKEKFKPDFFLYENNKSAARAIREQISLELEVPLQYINSALVSAQNRQRFYAHNIPNVPQPEDRGILLRDILESGIVDREKAYCLDAHYHNIGNETFNDINSYVNFAKRQIVAEPVCVAQRGIYESTGNRSVKIEGDNIIQVYEAREDGKTNTLITVSKDNMIAEPIRIGTIENEAINQDYDSKQYRVYSPDGKATTLCGQGGGLGAKTGLYATPIECYELDDEYFKGGFGEEQKPNLIGKIVCNNSSRNGSQPAQGTRIYSPNGKAICMDADSRKYIIDKADGTHRPIYEVKDGLITIKGKQYPIKLVDGYYIIRKLTVTECCRLQTLPDDYCRAVSPSQGYKGLGNGWTAEVIIHILKHMNIPLDEEIIVLSMYDGIGTGRYCFDKLGYKNIKYYAYEIDKYAMQIAMSNYPDIIQYGDAFQVREDSWKL